MGGQSTPLSRGLQEGLKEFARLPVVLICLDFDGCVAELVDDAEAARPVKATAEAVHELASSPGVHIAYVSGRGLETLRRLASPPEGTLLIGSHGAEMDLGSLEETPTGAAGLELTESQLRARATVIERLQHLAAGYEGAWVEHKPAGAALHARTMAQASARAQVLEAARSLAEEVPDAHARDGKDVVEVVVVHSSKGEGIETLRGLLEPSAVFFAGDDVTDEQGFAVLEPARGDIGVKVGEGETAAQFRIPEPAALADVLETIAAAR